MKKLITSNKYQFRVNYFADSTGHIWSEAKQGYLFESEDKNGYKKVTLMTTDKLQGKGHRFSVHRLILSTFYPVDNMTELTVDHIDGNIKLATLMHHEKCDGSGYPQGLMDSRINRFAKIIAILDAYEAMTSYRSYRLPLCPFKVIEIFENTGIGVYDTSFYLTFLERMVEEYIGKEVMLNDGTKCKVVLINKQKLSRPMVQTEDNIYIDLSKEKSKTIESLI